MVSSKENLLVSLCFEPWQPQRILLWLKQTSIDLQAILHTSHQTTHTQNYDQPCENNSHKNLYNTQFSTLREKLVHSISTNVCLTNFNDAQLNMFSSLFIYIHKCLSDELNDAQLNMFWSLFIFRGHSTQEPAAVVCDDEQGDLDYSAGSHRNVH